jgi:hypothetical protein
MCAALALVQYGLTSMIVMLELVSKSLWRGRGKGGVNGLRKLLDDGPYETETCSREIKVNQKYIDIDSLLW